MDAMRKPSLWLVESIEAESLAKRAGCARREPELHSGGTVSAQLRTSLVNLTNVRSAAYVEPMASKQLVDDPD